MAEQRAPLPFHLKPSVASHTFARLEDLFHRALPLDAEGRRRLLDQECEDADLRQQVEDLLAAESTRTEPFEQAVRQGMGWIAEKEAPTRIGPYRVLGEVGHGGFSTVYLAQRDDGHFDMQVAIKLVHRHLRSPEVLRRLRRERQILANLDHPNIARIFDGGSTDDGTPYVVMEYIVGQPIDQYCQVRTLSLQDRLHLFRQVCEAVQYAHRSLVLHRDLKPSNILVNEAGAVKLVDFGIAKVLHDEVDETSTTSDSTADRDLHTVLTQPGGQALTPEFASPEQFLGRPLTTATDVYSLGVVLYLLVSGRRPYVFEQRRWAEIERVLCDVQPPPPSRQDETAQHRSTELDLITLKALHKEPERRYASAEALSDDLRRHLHGLPIQARQDSWLYRSGKFVRRHAAVVGTLTALFLTLLVAVVITRWQALEAQRARRLAEQEQVRAERQTERAEQVARFLEELFEDTDPYANKGRDLTAYEVVQRGAERIRREVQDDPPLSAALMGTMGRVYRRLAHYEDAEELLRVAIATHRDTEGSPKELARALRDLAILYLEGGRCDAAEQTFQEAAVLETDPESLTLAHTLHYQGRNAMQCGDLTRAEDLIRRALTLRRRHHAEDDETVVDTESLLAELLFQRGDIEAAGKVFEHVLAKRRSALGGDHPKVAISLGDTAATLQTLGDPAAAIPLYTEALAIKRQAYGDQHGSVAKTLYNLGTAHGQLGQWPQARDFLQESLETHRQVYGDQHPGIADCLYELASVHRGLGQLDLAERSLRQDLELRRQLLGEDHLLLARTQLSLGSLVAKERPDEALALYRRALQIQDLQGDLPLRTAYTLTFLGRLLVRLDRAAEAEPHLRRALDIQRTLAMEPPIDRGLAEYHLARCLHALDRVDEALELAQSSRAHLEAALGKDDKRTRRAKTLLSQLQTLP